MGHCLPAPLSRAPPGLHASMRPERTFWVTAQVRLLHDELNDTASRDGLPRPSRRGFRPAPSRFDYFEYREREYPHVNTS